MMELTNLLLCGKGNSSYNSNFAIYLKRIMQFKDLDLSTLAGSKITFANGIHEKEQYPEPGMQAIILGACEVGVETPGDSFVVRIEVDFEPFSVRNMLLESALYPSKEGDGHPPVKAREAGQYHSKQYLYFDEDEIVSDLFVL